MKHTFSQVFLLFICLCAFASAIDAQEKPVAVKFDEYSDEAANIQILIEKANKFAERLAKEPKTTKGFIIYYSGSSFLRRDVERYDLIFDNLKTFLGQNPNSLDEKKDFEVGGRWGNLSKFAKVEFWFVPKGAEKPDTQIHRCFLCNCPEISVSGEDTIKDLSQNAVFTAHISGGSDEIEYAWKVSAGEIISGQGTPVIEVDLSKVKDKDVKITVELDGICEECSQESSLTTKIQQNSK